MDLAGEPRGLVHPRAVPFFVPYAVTMLLREALVASRGYGTMYAALAGVAIITAVFYHGVHGRRAV